MELVLSAAIYAGGGGRLSVIAGNNGTGPY